MSPFDLGVARYIREANVADSAEGRAMLAALALDSLGEGDATPEAVTAVLLERHTAWLLGGPVRRG